MKILTHQTDSIILEGLFNSLNTISDPFPIWNPSTPIFKILDKQKPDLFFCDSSLIKSSVLAAVAEYNIPTVVSGLIDFPQTKLHIIPEYINVKIRENVVQPYYLMRYAANLVKEYPKYPASNIVIYNTDQTPERILEYIKILQENNILFKVVGNKVPIPEYVGEVDLADIVGLCKTAKINIATDSEYIYDIAVQKRLILLMSDLQPIDNLLKLINYWDNIKEVQRATKQAYEDTIKNNTYYHRASDIFNLLGYKEEAEKCLLKVSEF